MDNARPLLLSRAPREISALRRTVDVVVVVLLAPFAGLALALLAAFIKLDSPGPVFYRHLRLGAGGRPFEVLKLRTMTVDADSRRAELEAHNSLSWPDFKLDHDPRVTRIGRWLRRASLDELPQLWHLLRGQMTLVGPRAASIDVSKYELWQTERLEYRPGLFGSWQAKGRGVVSFADRCRMDIHDRRTRSVVNELELCLASVLAVLGRKGRH